MTEISKKDQAALLEIVRTEAFKIDKSASVEQNALNFAIKIFIFAKTREIEHGKADKDAGKIR